VRYRDAASFRHALEHRLKERAGGEGARLARDPADQINQQGLSSG